MDPTSLLCTIQTSYWVLADPKYAGQRSHRGQFDTLVTQRTKRDSSWRFKTTILPMTSHFCFIRKTRKGLISRSDLLLPLWMGPIKSSGVCGSVRIKSVVLYDGIIVTTEPRRSGDTQPSQPCDRWPLTEDSSDTRCTHSPLMFCLCPCKNICATFGCCCIDTFFFCYH